MAEVQRLTRRWYTVAEVAEMLGYGETKVRMAIISGETRNVAALVRVPVPRTRKSAVWSVDEARQFLESARADEDPLYAGYVLMLVLGLRRGELLGLAWEDVDLEKHEASIRWQCSGSRGAAPPADEDGELGCSTAAA